MSRKHSRGGNKATLPQEFSEPLPLAGVSFCQSSAFGGICKRNQAKLGIIRGLTPVELSAASRLDYWLVLVAGPGFGALFGMIILPHVLLLLFAVDCVALIIGIAGIFEKNGNKNPAIFGIILSAAPIALLATFFVNG